MYDRLFPAGVAIAVSHDTIADDVLYDEEAAAVARAIDKRRREFAIGRACARRALASLGVPAGPIPVGPDRGPVWPGGIVGSITHSAGFAAAAVAWRRDVRGLGLDAEVAAPLDPRIVRLICTPAELERLRAAPAPEGTDWVNVAFSAKEAVHKVVSPASGVTLGFHDVELDMEPEAGAFRVRLVRPKAEPLPDLGDIRGRFTVEGPLVLTAAWLPATPA